MLFTDISRLTPIKEQLPDYVEFNHIKLVMAMLQRRYGMTDTHLHDNQESDTPSTPTPSSVGHSSKVSPSSGGHSSKVPSSAGASMNQSSSNNRSTVNKSFTQSTLTSSGRPQNNSNAPESPGGQKRKLPEWMIKGMAKQGSMKKTKKNSLFQ